MSSSGLVRWSGLVAMVAGVLLLIAEPLELLPVFDDIPFSELALTSVFTLQLTLYLAGLILIAVGLVGLYAHQSETVGLLGLVGFLVAFAGTVLFTGFFWANIFVAPALAVGAPEFLDQGGRFPGFRLSLIIYAVGWLLFGLASLKARVYPRAPVVALIIGAALDLFGAPLSGSGDRCSLRLAGLQPLLGESRLSQADPTRGLGELAATACNLGSKFVVLSQTRIFVQSPGSDVRAALVWRVARKADL